MTYRITVLPAQVNISAKKGENLLAVLHRAGHAPDAPCGGQGKCGKCRVDIDGNPALACQIFVEQDMTVTLPQQGDFTILTDGICHKTGGLSCGFALALDIGTTTVAAYLLNGTGQQICSASAPNPQAAFGADVISRIRHALQGNMDALTASIRKCVEQLSDKLCREAKISSREIRVVSMVGNPAMQQLFLGISPVNLTKIPYAPVLTESRRVSAKTYIPAWENAEFLIVPDISGFVGADTVGCILATGMDTREEMTLMVDIGTNGEMVMGNRQGLVACSTAAGPALEGAGISCGMGGKTGAIDRVWLENGSFRCRVIGGGEAKGICGSGLIDAVAAALDAGFLNSRGKILHPSGTLPLTEKLHLTQEDVRQVQLAKGAIAAGISLMAAHLGVQTEDIQKIFLAGAFGTFLDPVAACRIGLLPGIQQSRIQAIGNAAGSGAKTLACDPDALNWAQKLIGQVQYLSLAELPDFRRCFADNMRF